MWELVRCGYSEPGLMAKWLSQGYEPFAVSKDTYHDIIWLRKEFPDENTNNQDRPGATRSRRATKTTKG